MNNNRPYWTTVIITLCCISIITNSFAQNSDTTKQIRLAAGAEYQKSNFYQSLWGHNYRMEWTMPVTFPIFMLDTAFGGMMPVKAGGGNQSKSLQLKTKDGKYYALRSVNKTLGKVIPDDLEGTFLEDIANDEISMSHPYGALGVSHMAEAAGIFHTYPRYVYVPKQAALDSFNEKYGNDLYLLEERPDDDWSNAPNLGGFKKYYDSKTVRDKLYEKNNRKVDQEAFMKSRLFDMFIGDWDRHEDQWKWGEIETDSGTTFIPVPVDRDQAFSKYDGLLLKTAISSAGMKYLQSFDDDIKYPQGFSYERRNLDRFFTNELTLDDWTQGAAQLQNALTDAVIEQSIRQMPFEIFELSGRDIIKKLQSRRSHLQEYATKYYNFLSKNVDIVGSENKEFFVAKQSPGSTEISIYSKKDYSTDKPYYNRAFKDNETDEIRLYGVGGKDNYEVTGDGSKIKIRLIGGVDADSILLSNTGKKARVYDDKKGNIITPRSNAKLHLSNDSAVHAFEYDAFHPDKKGFKPIISYNADDRFYAGLVYSKQKQLFRKTPFLYHQKIGVNYSITQKAFSTSYYGFLPSFSGKWNLVLKGNYDAVRWKVFYGLGNKTLNTNPDINFYRTRASQWTAEAGINRMIGKSNFTLSGMYNSVNILNDSDKYYSKDFLPNNPRKFRTDYYAGGKINYNILAIKDSLVPEKGVALWANAGYNFNFKNDAASFGDFGGQVKFFIPLIRKFSLAITGGGETITGQPDFYQYPAIGGPASLRGYRTGRFRGKTTFFNSNELRFITNLKSYLLNGKIGLVGYFDDGRVWMPGETSNTMHTNYGGGLILVPFNGIYVDVTYGISKEDKLIQLTVRGKLGKIL